jgi:hypothetical protein
MGLILFLFPIVSFFAAAYAVAWGVDAALGGDPFPLSSKLVLRGRRARAASIACAAIGAIVAGLAAYAGVLLWFYSWKY